MRHIVTTLNSVIPTHTSGLRSAAPCRAAPHRTTRSATPAYRWGGASAKSRDTYVNLALSADFPALLHTLLRAPFPMSDLTVSRLSQIASTCARTLHLYSIYRVLHAQLDAQVQVLRERVLVITDNPFVEHGVDEMHLQKAKSLL